MNVENWLAVPLKRANTTTLTTALCAMVFLIAYEPEELEQIQFMRANAIVLITLHAALHVGMLNALRLMALQHMAHAEPALENYRDPRRISHLDLSAIWLGFYALTPYLADL